MARSVHETREITSQDQDNGGVLGEKQDIMEKVVSRKKFWHRKSFSCD